jgi:AcrR family transcriptional regulator
MPATKRAYHHGDLRDALVQAALELLEEGGATDLSLRAVARRAGVSAAAPYRHYADREALVSAVAAVGYRELAQRLAATHPAPATLEELVGAATVYVDFALERAALFRVMFGDPCDRDSEERVAAVAAVHEYLRACVERVFPGSPPDALATALWALVHGLASLHLDGKLDGGTGPAVAEQVGEAIRAVLAAEPQPPA